jgi:hypothetical protein
MSDIDEWSSASSVTSSSECDRTPDDESTWDDEEDLYVMDHDFRRRRRLVIMHAFVLVCATACFALDGTPGHVTASYRRQRANFDQLCMKMKSGLFLRSFRLRPRGFHELYQQLADALHKDPVQASRSSGEPIYPVLRLAMALRWLAGGSYIDICVLYGVSPEGFYTSLWLVLAVIVRTYRIQFDMQEASLQKVAAGFLDRQRKKVFRKVAGALDGMIVKIRRPSTREFPKPMQTWCRKGYYGLNVQAVCDAARRFTFVAIDCPGSVHDSLAFSLSTLGKHIHHLPPGYFILGDAAYKAIPRCLTPYEGRGTTEGEKNFSFYQSSLRINIECAFGALYKRWGVLWRPLSCSLKHNVLVVQACFALHNFCIDRGQPVDLRPPRGRSSVRIDEAPYFTAEGSPQNVLNGFIPEQFQRVNSNMAEVRRELTDEIAQRGMRRPVPRSQDFIARYSET